MKSFRAKVMGRANDDLDLFATTTGLNIRIGPGPQHEPLPVSPLAKGAKVETLSSDGIWKFVDVVDLGRDGGGGNGATRDVVGWVHGRYLRAV